MSAPYYVDDAVTLWHGDCLDVLRAMPDASVDAIVTDPPYGLEFMGKEWDAPWKSADVSVHAEARTRRAGEMGEENKRRYIAAGVNKFAAGRPFQDWCTLWATGWRRVLKPGGHLLAFGGTRTWHRLACAVEDAGFEMRDSIAWLYGSGFPKSLDVSKAIDKAAGKSAERGYIETTGGLHGGSGDTVGRFTGRQLSDNPVTAAAAQWQGWGTALKPAFEPVVVARKPLAGTVAANVLAWGCGALNIEACRVEGERTGDPLRFTKSKRDESRSFGKGGTSGDGGMFDPGRPIGVEVSPAGRWPTNVLLDDTQAAELDRQSGERPGASSNSTGSSAAFTTPRSLGTEPGYADQGGASRFFPTFRYEAKAPSLERPRAGAVAHPTVKPVDLMRWLVRLVTPPGGLVLDPFAGSGTTAEACVVEGFRCVLIEREADYLPLIVQRLKRPIAPVLDLEGLA